VSALSREPLSGWLRLFMFQQLFAAGTAIRIADRLWRTVSYPNSAAPSLQRVIAPYLIPRLILYVVFIAALFVGLALMMRRGRRTPTYWLVLLASIAPWRIADFMLSRLERSAAERAGSALQPSMPIPLWAYFLGYVPIVAWWFYWLRSQRVTEIFAVRRPDTPSGLLEPDRLSPVRRTT
jgi:hypothetical protein